MSSIATGEHKELAGNLRKVLATYTEAEDLINIGAYKKGSNKEIDYSLEKIGQVNAYLQQGMYDKYTFDEEQTLLQEIFQAEPTVEA